jgi:hypothetical protein
MKWLTAILALLLLGLGAFPAVESASAWLMHRSDSVQSISYISRDVHEFSAARRHGVHHHHFAYPPAD